MLPRIFTLLLTFSLICQTACVKHAADENPEVTRLQTELTRLEKLQTELEEKVKKPPLGTPSAQIGEELELLRSRMERIREKLRALNALPKRTG